MLIHSRYVDPHEYKTLVEIREEVYQAYVEDGKERDEAWDLAYEMTFNVEELLAKAKGYAHPSYSMKSCGCCDNLWVSPLTQVEDGGGVVEVYIDWEANRCVPKSPQD